eukprot:1137770-Pelagomonas_calceolata.AAC.3
MPSSAALSRLALMASASCSSSSRSCMCACVCVCVCVDIGSRYEVDLNGLCQLMSLCGDANRGWEGRGSRQEEGNCASPRRCVGQEMSLRPVPVKDRKEPLLMLGGTVPLLAFRQQPQGYEGRDLHKKRGPGLWPQGCER